MSTGAQKFPPYTPGVPTVYRCCDYYVLEPKLQLWGWA